MAGELDADTLPSCAIPGASAQKSIQRGRCFARENGFCDKSVALPDRYSGAGNDHQPARSVPGRRLERVAPFSRNRPVGAAESGSVTGLTLELEH